MVEWNYQSDRLSPPIRNNKKGLQFLNLYNNTLKLLNSWARGWNTFDPHFFNVMRIRISGYFLEVRKISRFEFENKIKTMSATQTGSFLIPRNFVICFKFGYKVFHLRTQWLQWDLEWLNLANIKKVRLLNQKHSWKSKLGWLQHNSTSLRGRHKISAV